MKTGRKIPNGRAHKARPSSVPDLLKRLRNGEALLDRTWEIIGPLDPSKANRVKINAVQHMSYMVTEACWELQRTVCNHPGAKTREAVLATKLATRCENSRNKIANKGIALWR